MAILSGGFGRRKVFLQFFLLRRNVIDSIDRPDRVLREVPGLKLLMDSCNYFRREELSQMDPMLEEMFRRLGKRIVLAHAEDVKAAADGTDLPAAGRGVLN